MVFLAAGGYYVIEQARQQLHLVALNTNFYSEMNHITAESEDMDPGGQWAWLESILLKARRRRGTVGSSRACLYIYSFQLFIELMNHSSIRALLGRLNPLKKVCYLASYARYAML